MEPTPGLSQRIKECSAELGFSLCGIAPATVGLGEDRLRHWLDEGKHGEMEYMQRNLHARIDPNHVLAGVKSVVMVAMNYAWKGGRTVDYQHARISRYAWGSDYHDVLRQRLTLLGQFLQEMEPGARWRPVVDSAPLMERDYARLAGLGWFGKNTLLLNRKAGSLFFLGGLLVDVELEYDVPFETGHCGSCTRCLDACPTDAFEGPYRLDPRKCISYLTIEHRAEIPLELRPVLGNWVFGCDVCQDVCPWNRKSPATAESAFAPKVENHPLDLMELLQLDDTEFRQRYRGTPLFRTKRDRVLRNACIAAGNSGDLRYLPVLKDLVQRETGPLQEAAQWAIERLTTSDSPHFA